MPEVRIKRCLRDIAENRYLRIHIALTDYTSSPLFQITRTPRTVEIMQRNQPVLHVGPCSHLGSAAHEHAHLTGAYLREQLLLLDLRIGFMDEGNLPGRHTVGDELFPNVIIDVEGVLLRGIIGKKGFASALRSSYCTHTLGRGNITEDELGQFIFLTSLPDAQDVADTGVDLAGRIIRQ